MRGRRWLRYLTIGLAVLILSGCRHDSWMLHGDWSLGMRRDGGCRGGGISDMPGPMGPPIFPTTNHHPPTANMPPAETFAVAPHAKFHPVPTRPVFAPRPMFAARAVEGPAPPARHHAPPERAEELPSPEPAPQPAASKGWRLRR